MNHVVGGDSETGPDGRPFTFQFHDDNGSRLIWVKAGQATKHLAAYLDDVSRPDIPTVIYVHNLGFDLISFFYDKKDKFLDGEFDFKFHGWRAEGVYGNVKFARLTRSKRLVWLVDTGTFFQTSLEKAAALVCPQLPKLRAPTGLGQKIFTRRDKGFIAYALRDAEISWHLGNQIDKFCRTYDIPQVVSAPHAAARIFRRAFLNKTLSLPPKQILFAALKSYHGGKNGLYCDPGWYKDISCIDIVSAYPAAMRVLPAFSQDAYFKIEIDVIRNKFSPSRIPYFGVYCISGVARECVWPCISDHRFKYIKGEFSDIWVTGPELIEGLKSKELQLTKCWGYYYDAKRDKEPSPFKSFIDHFFKKKNTATNPVERTFFKLMMNSLYGKFIQKHPTAATSSMIYDVDKGELKNAIPVISGGGLFHPFIATLITGIVRARIHQLEHKYKSLHTATDGIFTRERSPRLSPGLGGLSLETRGTVALFRNKLYVFYEKSQIAKKHWPKSFPSFVFKGYNIIKFGLHGFHGKISTLELMLVNGTRYYEFTKVNKLKESFRRGLSVNKFEKRVASLKLEK